MMMMPPPALPPPPSGGSSTSSLQSTSSVSSSAPRHFAPLLSPVELEILRTLVFSRLTDLGVHSVANKKMPSVLAAKKRSAAATSAAGSSSSSCSVGTPSASSSSMRTPGKQQSSSSTHPHLNRVFRRPLRDLSMVMVSLCEPAAFAASDHGTMVPKFLSFICDWLRQPELLAVEGLFRKAGSTSRQKNLRHKFEESENWIRTLAEASVLDVASLLKQWLRELPEPLISAHVQKLLLECLLLEDESAREEAILSSCCLLSANHACTLVYLLRFFNDVAQESSKNKMDLSNLAIVLTPTLFPMEEDPSTMATAGKMNGSSSCEKLLAQKTEIVETLFRLAYKVGYLPSFVNDAYSACLTLPTFGTSLENLGEDGGAQRECAGPSARRRKKTKRRSGSLSRVISATMKGIQKAISRSATPVAPRKQSSADGESVHCTPLFKIDDDVAFTSPPGKRKAFMEPELSPRSKQHRKLDSHTPKVRGRSFSVKRFKRRKSLKSGSADVVTSNFQVYPAYSPLPSKPAVQLRLMTPKTPASLDLPSHGCDISSPDAVDANEWADKSLPKFTLDCGSSLSIDGISSAKEASAASRDSSFSVTESGSSPNKTTEDRKRSLSPCERKIGMLRRKSRETTRKVAASGATSISQYSPEVGEKPSLANYQIQGVRAQLKKGPGKTMSSAHIPETFVKKRQESLDNLREDISTFIEKSFGPATTSGEGGGLPGLSDPDEEDGFDVNYFGLGNSRALDDGSVAVAFSDCSLRRQSSAFEFSTLFAPSGQLRRQSSAFEIAARNREQYHVYENFDRMGTRASLRRKNSSVKDLVKKLEASKLTQDDKKKLAPDLPLKVSGKKKEDAGLAEQGLDSAFEENDWMDASEFFKNPPATAVRQLMAQETSGSKRSSIIKIRKEKKGIVSQSVQTFTYRPAAAPSTMMTAMMPPPPRQLSRQHQQPAVQPVTPSASSRRLSARMGVSTRTTAMPTQPAGAAKLSAIVPNTSCQSQTGLTRRQTLTGIRTSVNYKHNPTGDKKPSTGLHIYQNNMPPFSNHSLAVKTSDLHRRPVLDRKSKRLEGRRHLTIGYQGEIRSPLAERQNTIVATVQRSKSAQTPLQSKSNRKVTRVVAVSESSDMVRRSHSLRSPLVEENHQSFSTPKTEKIRRHQSERTPRSSSKKQAIKPPIATPRMLPHKMTFVTSQDSSYRPTKQQTSPSARKSPRITKLY